MRPTTVLALSLSLVLACCDSGPKLTEAMVQNRLDEIDRATSAQDVEAVVGFLAADAVVQVTTHVYGGARTDTLSRDQYATLLAESFALADEIEYERTTRSLELGEDGRAATVESVVLEGLRRDGRWVRTRTRERAVFEMREGRPLVTSVVGNTTIYEGTLESFVFFD